MHCDWSIRTRRSISVNTVNHRLADGNVNCSRGNNKTQRMLLFIDTHTVTDKGLTGRVCVCVCVCNKKVWGVWRKEVAKRVNVVYEFTNTLLCLYASRPCNFMSYGSD